MRREQLILLGGIAAVALWASTGRAQTAASAVVATRVAIMPFTNKAGGKYKAAGREAAAAITAFISKEKVAELAADPKDKTVAVRVDGSYTEKDGKLAFSVKFTDGTGKKVLGSFGPVAGAPGDYAAVAEATAAALDGRRQWGNANLGWPPPASWAAWQEAQAAWKVFNTSDWAGALTRFQAVEKLDPNYVNAKYGIWVSFGNMGRTAQRDSMNALVKPLMLAIPGLVSDIYTWLNASNTRDYETMYQVGKRLFANDPRSAYAQALPANHTGRFAEVISLYNQRDTSATTRGWRPWDANVLYAMHALGQLNEAVALSRDIEKTRGFDFVSANLQLYHLAALGRFTDVENVLARVSQLPISAANTYGGALNTVGWEYRAHGFEQQAQDIFRRRAAFYRALTPAQQQQYAVVMAASVFNAGEYAEARERYEKLIAAAPNNLNHWASLGWIGLLTGDDALFRRVDERLAPEANRAATSDALYYRGELYAQKGDCAAAEKYLRDGLAAGITRWDYALHWWNGTGKAKNCTALPALTGPRN